MKKYQTVSVRMTSEEIEAVNVLSRQHGLGKSDLIRTALSNLSNENSFSNIVSDSVEDLAVRLARIEKKQELFARTIGNIATLKDSAKSPELSQKLIDRLNKIVDTLN